MVMKVSLKYAFYFFLKYFKKNILYFAMRCVNASYLPNLSLWEVALPHFGRISVVFLYPFPKSSLELTSFSYSILHFEMLAGGIILYCNISSQKLMDKDMTCNSIL